MPRRRSRYTKPLLAGLVGAGTLLYAWLGGQAADAGIWGGEPRTDGYALATLVHRLDNRCHSLGYSEWRANALWVAYRLRPVAKRGGLGREPFETDARTLRRIEHRDYTGTGYDRGHLAPSYAIAALCGKAAQRETFLMSNISPQKPRLNQKLWQRLEEIELDEFTHQLGELQVLTGPVFDTQQEHTRSGVEIPDAFYKVYYVPARAGQPARSLAFLMPQEVRGTEPLARYLVSIDTIEAQTGLDFLSELPDTLEASLEARATAAPVWQLERLGNRPPRY